MEILFVQFANSMFNYSKENVYYYDEFYKRNKKLGYIRSEYTFEIPKWIAEVDFCLGRDKFETSLLWCEHSVEEIINCVKIHNPDYVLFSLMDCNAEYILDAINRCKNTKFIVGTYNDNFVERLNVQDSVTVAGTVEETIKFLGAEYSYGTDYKLFKNYSTVPRLTMSQGCTNNCKFCTISNKVTPIEERYILQQVDSFKGLNFELVYIDDKTFGQCTNYILLGTIYNEIRSYNPKFKGFIIQTTFYELYKKYDEFVKLHVSVAELGLESYNDPILKKYNKPASELNISECLAKCRARNKIKLIANVIVGFPEETEESYNRTQEFLDKNKDILIGINPAIYTDYDSEERTGELSFTESPNKVLNEKAWITFNNFYNWDNATYIKV